ncbi:MAG: helix-turn-helix domain-containing protein [Candidatus Dormibacteraceae bacterium]
MSPLPASRRVLRARDAIDARYTERLLVDDLARLAAMSRSHFSRRFTATFGTPPHRYLLERRIERGKHLLVGTAPILTVALAVGFDGAASFCAAFKKVVGVSPSAYRRLAAPVYHPGVPTCWVMAWTRPSVEVSTNAKESPPGRG